MKSTSLKQLLATRAILVLLALHQSLRHAPEQVFQIGIFFSRLDITIGGQQLRDSLLELEGGDDFVMLQIPRVCAPLL